MKTTEKHIAELVNYSIDYLKDNSPSCYGGDLHNEMFNQDYYIIGTYEAKKWLKNGPGIFEAIEEIKNYEQDNFGEVNTDFSDPEKVVNMYVYIKGEEILNNLESLQDAWDRHLDNEDLAKMIEELETL